MSAAAWENAIVSSGERVRSSAPTSFRKVVFHRRSRGTEVSTFPAVTKLVSVVEKQRSASVVEILAVNPTDSIDSVLMYASWCQTAAYGNTHINETQPMNPARMKRSVKNKVFLLRAELLQ